MKNVELGPEELSVIAAAREGLDPTEMQRARVRQGLDAKITAGVVAPVLATSTAFATLLKVGVGVTVTAMIGTGVYWAPRLSHKGVAPSPARTYVPAKTPTIKAAAQPPKEISAEPAPARIPQPAVDQPPASAHPRTSMRRRETGLSVSTDLAGELALLTQVSAATKQSDVAGAAELLRTYDQRYPAGLLAQERAATGILVQCAAGRVQAARSEARRFLDRWPRSPLVARIQNSCAAQDLKP
jgi:hypothetical protein